MNTPARESFYDDEISEAMARCPCNTSACQGHGCTVGGRYDPVTDTLEETSVSNMPKFVRDPDGITHYLDPVHHPDEEWQTRCQRLVYFSEKWKSCFPFDNKPNCIACLAL